MCTHIYIAGQERYRAITASHYRRAAGALLVYDVTNPTSFAHAMTDWLRDLRDASDVEQDVLSAIMLVGNKTDLESKSSTVVSESQHNAACQQEKLYSMRTSAKTGDNVIEAFNQLLIAIHTNAKNRDEEKDINQTVVLGKDIASQPRSVSGSAAGCSNCA